MTQEHAPGRGLTSLVSALGPDARPRAPVCTAATEFRVRRSASAAASWLDASVRDVAAGAGAVLRESRASASSTGSTSHDHDCQTPCRRQKLGKRSARAQALDGAAATAAAKQWAGLLWPLLLVCRGDLKLSKILGNCCCCSQWQCQMLHVDQPRRNRTFDVVDVAADYIQRLRFKPPASIHPGV